MVPSAFSLVCAGGVIPVDLSTPEESCLLAVEML